MATIGIYFCFEYSKKEAVGNNNKKGLSHREAFFILGMEVNLRFTFLS